MPTQTHFWFDCSGAEIPLKRSLMMLVYAQSSWAQSVSICKHDFPNVFPVFSLFQWHYWELASFLLVFGDVPGLGIHNKLPGMFKMTQPPKEMWGGKNQKYCRFGIDFFFPFSSLYQVLEIMLVREDILQPWAIVMMSLQWEIEVLYKNRVMYALKIWLK